MRLVPLGEAHAPRVISWRNAETNRRFFLSNNTINLEEQIAWTQQLAGRIDDFTYAIESNSDAVGMLGLYNIKYDPIQTGEIGRILVDSRHRRHGIASVAINILLEFAFHEIMLQYVYANILEQNVASRSLFEKIGFQEKFQFQTPERRSVIQLEINRDLFDLWKH